MRARMLAAVVVVAVLLCAVLPRAAWANGPDAEQTVQSHESTRVRVQLVVLGVAAFLVIGVGTAAYVARKKLGLDAPAPPDDASSHH